MAPRTLALVVAASMSLNNQAFGFASEVVVGGFEATKSKACFEAPSSAKERPVTARRKIVVATVDARANECSYRAFRT